MARKNSQLTAVFEPEQSDCSNKDLNFKIRSKFKFLEKHQKFMQTIISDKTRMVFADGFAGTAKTYLAVYSALTLLEAKKINSIVYLRSVVESATQKIGHLPGELDQKFLPYSLPLLDKLDEIVSKQTSDKLLRDEYIKCLPVNFTRGLTFHDSVIIIDEAQNLTKQELITLLTRFGDNSKYVVIGDTHQSDINGKSGFRPILNAFDSGASRDEGIHTFSFDKNEIVRSKILKYIVEVLEKM
jgi:phosphate starvation-inducible protein PhoH and related proteins